MLQFALVIPHVEQLEIYIYFGSALPGWRFPRPCPSPMVVDVVVLIQYGGCCLWVCFAGARLFDRCFDLVDSVLAWYETTKGLFVRFFSERGACLFRLWRAPFCARKQNDQRAVSRCIVVRGRSGTAIPSPRCVTDRGQACVVRII